MSGFLQLKYWFRLLQRMQHLKLNFIGFITDSCSIGLSAGKFIVTPTSEMIPLGCSYLGLLVDDWKYWACYRRPRMVLLYSSRVSERTNVSVQSYLQCGKHYEIPFAPRISVHIRADLGRISLRPGACPGRFITYKAVLSALIPKELGRTRKKNWS